MASSGASPVISASLNQIYGENINKKFKLTGSQVLIGRAFSANIRLVSTNVSRKHCILTYTDKGWTIKDNNSQNGTWVSGTRLNPNESRLLEYGDIIFLGPPRETPQAFCMEISYDWKGDEKSPVEHMHKTNHLLENNSLEEPSGSSNCSTPGRQSSLSTRDVDSQVIEQPPAIKVGPSKVSGSSEKVEICREIINLEPPDVMNSKNSASETKNVCKRKFQFPHSVQVFSSVSDECKRPKVKEELPVNEKCDKPVTVDQIHEISSTGNDQFDESASQSLLDVEQEKAVEQPCQNIKASEVEILKSEAVALTEEIRKLKSENIKLKSETEKIKEQIGEKDKLKALLEGELKAKNEIQRESFEENLTCNICTELLIKPTVLECSHTFCEFCINQWKKKKNECPNCRRRIDKTIRVLVLEHFMENTLLTLLTPDQIDKRKELMKERQDMEQQEKQCPKQSPKANSTRRRRRVIRRQMPAREPDSLRPAQELVQELRGELVPPPGNITTRSHSLIPPYNHHLPLHPHISYYVNNTSYRLPIPEVLISDNEMDTINIYVS